MGLPPSAPLARPQVIAHRGASHDIPEHTLAAYTKAIRDGADGLECDVRLTMDGHLVCVHDRRVDRTSNGRGRVSTLELTHLEGLDWGSWKSLPQAAGGDEEPDRDANSLLTLRRLLRAVAHERRVTGRPVQMVIETKHPTRYAGLVERTLVQVLESEGWLTAPDEDGESSSPVRVMSFSLLALQRLRQLSPGLPLVYLMVRVPLAMRDGALPKGAVAAGIGVGILRSHPEYVRKVHARGRAVHVWTVDHPDDVQRCLDAGVDAIITNRPAEVLAQVNQASSDGFGAAHTGYG